MPGATSCRKTTSPCHSLTRIVWQARPARRGGERGQLVVMGREQRAAAVDLVQMLDRGPGDRQPVEGRGAAADLVEDHQRLRAGLVQDRRGLDHLDHEGRAAARQVVGGADAAEQPVDDADPRRLGRHEGADLGQDRDQRVLAQEGRSCRPCSGRSAATAGGPGRQRAVVGDEGRACRPAAPPRPPDGGRPRSRRRRRRRPPAGTSRRSAASSAWRGGDVERGQRRRGARRSRSARADRPRRPGRRTARSSSASAASAAWRSRLSSSPSSTVVKRMAPAMVWRWMKRPPAAAVELARHWRPTPRRNSRARCCGGSCRRGDAGLARRSAPAAPRSARRLSSRKPRSSSSSGAIARPR